MSEQKLTNEEMYVDYLANFLTVSKFAKHYNLSVIRAGQVIDSGRKAVEITDFYQKMTTLLMKTYKSDSKADSDEIDKRKDIILTVLKSLHDIEMLSTYDLIDLNARLTEKK